MREARQQISVRPDLISLRLPIGEDRNEDVDNVIGECAAVVG